jgi:thiamine kinase-like enzyme
VTFFFLQILGVQIEWDYSRIAMENLKINGWNDAVLDEETTLALVRGLARLHCHFAGKKPQIQRKAKDMVKEFAVKIAENVPKITTELMEEVLPELKGNSARQEEIMTLLRSMAISGNLEKLIEGNKHSTLVHLDSREANLFTRRNADGKIELCFVDWQNVAIGTPFLDLGNVLSHLGLDLLTILFTDLIF